MKLYGLLHLPRMRDWIYYCTLNGSVTRVSRVRILSSFRVIKMYRGKMTGELAELLDREADLLNRGRGSRSLKGLRQSNIPISRRGISLI